MTVATLIAILQSCRPDAHVVYPNMEIDERIEVGKVTEHDKGYAYPDEHRYLVILR
jgi:hypothetical protein